MNNFKPEPKKIRHSKIKRELTTIFFPLLKPVLGPINIVIKKNGSGSSKVPSQNLKNVSNQN